MRPSVGKKIKTTKTRIIRLGEKSLLNETKTCLTKNQNLFAIHLKSGNSELNISTESRTKIGSWRRLEADRRKKKFEDVKRRWSMETDCGQLLDNFAFSSEGGSCNESSCP